MPDSLFLGRTALVCGRTCVAMDQTRLQLLSGESGHMNSKGLLFRARSGKGRKLLCDSLETVTGVSLALIQFTSPVTKDYLVAGKLYICLSVYQVIVSAEQ